MGQYLTAIQRGTAKIFNQVRSGRGKGRQHLIHRAVDAYLKDVYKGYMVEDEEGVKAVREVRAHKKQSWWEIVKGERWAARTSS